MVIAWFILSFIVGFIGSNRRVGFWGAFLWSLFLSPLIGVIIAVASDSNESIRVRNERFKLQKEQTEVLKKINNKESISDEVQRLSDMRNKGLITDVEFDAAKKKLFNL